MDPTLVDLVSDPPRLVYPDGSWCPTTRTQARIEALRIVRQAVPVGSPPAPTGTLSLAASGCGSETGTGGAGLARHGDDPSGPIFYTPCAPGVCAICDDRRDEQWRWASEEHA